MEPHQDKTTKKEWEELLSILSSIYDNFRTNYHDAQHGRLKKTRTEGERKVGLDVDLACYHIEKNWEAYVLLTGEGDNISDYSRAIVWDEFKMNRYFSREMPQFLDNLRVKIKSLE